MSIKAYQRAATQADSPRELEYRAFGQVTAALVRIKEGPQEGAPPLIEAVEANRRLWTLLGADCAIPENQLPPALRAHIISLSLWVTRYTREVLLEAVALDPLIDVNRTIMEGLAPR